MLAVRTYALIFIGLVVLVALWVVVWFLLTALS
jgi:hypothetical protein